MKKTTFSDFQAELRATGAYRTAEDHRAPQRAKAGALTTIRFSWGVVSVFPKTGLYRAFGRLTCKKWEELCFRSVLTAEKLGMNVIIEGFETSAKTGCWTDIHSQYHRAPAMVRPVLKGILD